MRNSRLFLSFLVVLSIATAAVSETETYAARNTINSGDDTINVIADRGSEVVVVIGEENSLQEIARETALLLAEGTSPTGNLPRFMGGDFSDDLAIAEYMFSVGQYSTSAVFYEKALSHVEEDSRNSQAIEGMVAASYFGSSRHVEGLLWICERYQSLPPDDVRFRHAIHAHLRSLTVNLGHEHAEQVLEYIVASAECRSRRDFSPVWIPIHLADMRALERSVAPAAANYGISNRADLEYAEGLISEGDSINFLDYLHFVLGNYQTILEEYPNSLVTDLAMLGAAEDATYPQSAELFLLYAEEFETHRRFAINSAFLEFLEAGDLEQASALLDEQEGERFLWQSRNNGIFFQVDEGIRVWVVGAVAQSFDHTQTGLISEFYTNCPRIVSGLLEPDTFPESIRQLRAYGEAHQDNFAPNIEFQGWYGAPGRINYDGVCGLDLIGDELVAFADLFAEASTILERGSREERRQLAATMKVCGDIRDGRDILGEGEIIRRAEELCDQMRTTCERLGSYRICRAISLQRFSATLLMNLYNEAPWEAPSDLFLAGLAYRNMEHYEEYARSMEAFVERHSGSEFLDDALTELGWYHFRVTRDYERAERYLLEVAEEFRGSNSENNALNWLVLLYLDRRNIILAAEFSARLAAIESTIRMRTFTAERNEHLQIIASNAGNSFSPVISVEMRPGQRLREIQCPLRISSSNPRLGEQGAYVGRSICSVNGQPFESVLEFYAIVASHAEAGSSVVNVLFGEDEENGTGPYFDVPVSLFGF